MRIRNPFLRNLVLERERVCYNADMSCAKEVPRVLVFIVTGSYAATMMLRGVYAAARQRGYQVKVVPHATVRMPVDDYVRLWRPVGILASDERYLPSVSFGVACVAMGGNRALLRKVPGVADDFRDIARSALSVLRSHDAAHYAFVGFSRSGQKEAVWSRERRRAFRELAKDGKLSLVSPQPPLVAELGDDIETMPRLMDWIGNVPKPCRIFAANDFVGNAVLSACALSGLRVPDDVAVVGVDNDPVICGSSVVPLSSVAVDFRQMGRRAMEILDEMIRRPGRPCRVERVGVSGVYRRQSVRMPSSDESLVSRATDFIRQNAGFGIGVADVANHLGVSPRTMEIAFAKQGGKGVLATLQEARLQIVMRRLCESDDDVEALTEASGYRSKSHLQKMFKLQTGMTLNEWRRKHT